MGRLGWGEFGRRVGVTRILALLEKHAISASFFVPAVSALIDPDGARRITAAGHEVGIHGWIHENNSQLPYETERDLMLSARDTLARLSGLDPQGLRSPNGHRAPTRWRSSRRWGCSTTAR